MLFPAESTMPLVIRDTSITALYVFDRLLELRDVCVNNLGSQLVIALFFASSLFVAIVLFVYWCSCAIRVLSANDAELTEEEIEPMLWHRNLREQLWHFFHSFGQTLS